jgi:hypothetical protein
MVFYALIIIFFIGFGRTAGDAVVILVFVNYEIQVRKVFMRTFIILFLFSSKVPIFEYSWIIFIGI